jgi:ribosome maturation factor RimP
LLQGLEAELGVEEAEDISVEVSSPGAERTLIIPQDLLRFKVAVWLTVEGWSVGAAC